MVPLEIDFLLDLWDRDGRFVPSGAWKDRQLNDEAVTWRYRNALTQGEHPQEINDWGVWLEEDRQALLEVSVGKLMFVLSSFGSIDLQFQGKTVSVLNKKKAEVRRFRSQKTMLGNLLVAARKVLELDWIPRYLSADGKWYYSAEDLRKANLHQNIKVLTEMKSSADNRLKKLLALKSSDPFSPLDPQLMTRMPHDIEAAQKEIADIDSRLSLAKYVESVENKTP